MADAMMQLRQLRPSARLVGHAIAYRLNRGAEMIFSWESLKRDTGLAVSTLQRAVGDLKTAGVIAVRLVRRGRSFVHVARFTYRPPVGDKAESPAGHEQVTAVHLPIQPRSPTDPRAVHLPLIGNKPLHEPLIEPQRGAEEQPSVTERGAMAEQSLPTQVEIHGNGNGNGNGLQLTPEQFRRAFEDAVGDPLRESAVKRLDASVADALRNGGSRDLEQAYVAIQEWLPGRFEQRPAWRQAVLRGNALKGCWLEELVDQGAAIRAEQQAEHERDVNDEKARQALVRMQLAEDFEQRYQHASHEEIDRLVQQHVDERAQRKAEEQKL